MGLYTALLFAAAVLHSSTAYETGADASACGNMTPDHGANAQSSAAPYTVTLSSSKYCNNAQIKVTVHANDNDKEIEGIMVQVRQSGSSTPVAGTWPSLPKELKTFTCSGSANSITHNTELESTGAWAIFQMPAASVGTVNFHITVVTDKLEFWTGVRSADVTYDASICPLAAPAPGPDSISGTTSLKFGMLLVASALCL